MKQKLAYDRIIDASRSSDLWGSGASSGVTTGVVVKHGLSFTDFCHCQGVYENDSMCMKNTSNCYIPF